MTMPDTTELFLHDQLVERRQRLESTAKVAGMQGGIAELLNEVDAALARMEARTYGLCDTCHDPVEKDRLLADPLVRLCLDHLSADQRRALEQDLELAGQLQRGLLPETNLRFGGWTVSYHYRPLGMVSGDYCDLVAQENGSANLFFALGDVSGKGVAASMLMSQLHAILRTLTATNLPAQALVERASRIFCETTMSTFFATLICGRADSSGGIELCNAGHCPALARQQGKVARLEATGVPIGMFCDGRYSTRQVRLAPGETLFLYTDGVSEARSRTNEEYGETRLIEFLTQNPDLAPEALICACLDDLNGFRSGQPLLDDLTIMAIQRTH
jgi:sigma-B regulation protein RsbU (phosphoserine phosphatase)